MADDERAKFSQSFNSNTGMPAMKAAANYIGSYMSGGSTNPSDPKAEKNRTDAIQRRLVRSQTSDEQ